MTAVELGLTGWVRNRWDSSVEVVAEGSQPALDRLEAALHRGPRSAFVTGVNSDREPPSGEFSRFLVRMTE
jgi:acylphosphatase